MDKNTRDSPYLEVVPEGPGAEHLEESVVVNVFPDVVQVIVFPSGADAFLSVGRTPQFRHGVRRVDGV